ncbi:hypothetical protein CI102_12278 [Trichoderma harzianum]|nr:hypothetical protein CI102_12278 [Trichoderma harzianum]
MVGRKQKKTTNKKEGHVCVTFRQSDISFPPQYMNYYYCLQSSFILYLYPFDMNCSVDIPTSLVIWWSCPRFSRDGSIGKGCVRLAPIPPSPHENPLTTKFPPDLAASRLSNGFFLASFPLFFPLS